MPLVRIKDSDVTALQTEVKTLKGQDNPGAIASLKQEIKSLQTELKSLSKTVKTLQGEVATLKRKK